MRKNLYWLFLTTVFILSLAMASVGPASPGDPVIRLEPHNNAAGVGETFTVNITVTDITEEESLYGWECSKITFNPSIINVVNVTEGPFLKDTGYSTFFSKKIDNTTGTVKALGVISELPFPPTGASGSGTLATIIFKAVGQGATGLVFGEKDDTTLQTVLGEYPYQHNNPIVHTAEDGFFNNGGPQISLDIVAVSAVGIVVVVAVVGFYFWRKRASTRT
jgi:hypothetical protein